MALRYISAPKKEGPAKCGAAVQGFIKGCLFESLLVNLFQLALFTGFLRHMIFNHAHAAQFFRLPVRSHVNMGEMLLIDLLAFVVCKFAVMMPVQFGSPTISINLYAFLLRGRIDN